DRPGGAAGGDAGLRRGARLVGVPRSEVGAARPGGRGGGAGRAAPVAAGRGGPRAGPGRDAADPAGRGDVRRPALPRAARRRARHRPRPGGDGEAGRRPPALPGRRGARPGGPAEV
ncbi:MAG: hypothetical protein AVDCRST_MAG41-3046, partial [uncultured Corynebacteriales bacterium]